MINTKKSLLVMAIGTSLSLSGVANSAIGDYTGSFKFYDVAGVFAIHNPTLYGVANLADDPWPAGSTAIYPLIDPNPVPVDPDLLFVSGGLDFTSLSGSYTDETLFNGAQWLSKGDAVFYYNPAGTATQSFTYEWTKRTVDDGSFNILV